jgi:hypothetical protein
MDEIHLNWKKFARNFWGRTSTARIRPVRPKKYLLCKFCSRTLFEINLNKISTLRLKQQGHKKIPKNSIFQSFEVLQFSPKDAGSQKFSFVAHI